MRGEMSKEKRRNIFLKDKSQFHGLFQAVAFPPCVCARARAPAFFLSEFFELMESSSHSLGAFGGHALEVLAEREGLTGPAQAEGQTGYIRGTDLRL